MPHLCQLAQVYSAAKIANYPVIAEPKYDGVRVMVDVRDGIVTRFFTRNNKEVSSLWHFAHFFQQLADGGTFIYDGEVYGKSCADFDRVSGQVRQKSYEAHNVRYCLFDVQVPRMIYENRRTLLERQLIRVPKVLWYDYETPIFLPPQAYLYNEEEVEEFYAETLAKGFEGIMLKDPLSYYEFRRAWSWMKVKPTVTCKMQIEDAIEGLGKHEGRLGSFLGTLNTGASAYLGGGFDDSDRETLWKTWLTEPEKLKGRFCEVGFQSITASGSLRFPKFLRWLDDRSSFDQ